MDQEVVFSGRGLGHGIGLCQWGARKWRGGVLITGRSFLIIIRDPMSFADRAADSSLTRTSGKRNLYEQSYFVL